LGVEDRFNLCAGTDEETVEFCRQVYASWRPKILANEEPIGKEMTKGIALAMSQVVPTINYNAFLRYAATFLGLTLADYPLESLDDYADYATTVAIFKGSNTSRILHWISSKLVQVAVKGGGYLRSVHEGILRAKYDGKLSYEPDERCPADIKINYQ